MNKLEKLRGISKAGAEDRSKAEMVETWIIADLLALVEAMVEFRNAWIDLIKHGDQPGFSTTRWVGAETRVWDLAATWTEEMGT